jgi:folylpolyglutamate synthase/dihydropteroate synthase
VAAVTAAKVETADTPVSALRALRGSLNEDDKVLVFGSFLTVGEVLADTR